MTTVLPRRRDKGLVVRTVGDETVVFDVAAEIVTCLDPFTASVWSAADGTADEPRLASRLDVRPVEVGVALARLDAAGLLHKEGLTRRGLLRGAAAVAAAVPLASVLAPAPAFAASGEGGNGPATVTASAGSCGINRQSTISFTLAAFDPGTSVTVEALRSSDSAVLGSTVTTTDGAGGASGSFVVSGLSSGSNTLTIRAVSSTETATTTVTVSCLL